MVTSAKGTTCENALAVFRVVSTWVDPTHYSNLDAPRHPDTFGYRRSVALVGDSSWNIRCTMGSKLIRGFTAQ